MVIYFITNNKKRKDTAEITKILRSFGHEVVGAVPWTKDKIDLPAQFDVLIAEIQEFSTDINYQIVLALSDKKSVLCLYPEKSNIDEELSSIRGSIAKNLTLKPYSQASLPFVIKEFLDDLVNGGHAERFNFFLTPELKEYINWIPTGKGLTKSGFIRELIRDQMKKDNNYQVFRKKKK